MTSEYISKLMEVPLTPKVQSEVSSGNKPIYTADPFLAPHVQLDCSADGILNWPEAADLFMVWELINYGMRFRTLPKLLVQARLSDRAIKIFSHRFSDKIRFEDGENPTVGADESPISLRIVNPDTITAETEASYVRFVPFSPNVAIILQEGRRIEWTHEKLSQLSRAIIYHNTITRRVRYTNISWGGFINCNVARMFVSTPMAMPSDQNHWPVIPGAVLYDDWRCMHIIRSWLLDRLSSAYGPSEQLQLDQISDKLPALTINIINTACQTNGHMASWVLGPKPHVHVEPVIGKHRVGELVRTVGGAPPTYPRNLVRTVPEQPNSIFLVAEVLRIIRNDGLTDYDVTLFFDAFSPPFMLIPAGKMTILSHSDTGMTVRFVGLGKKESDQLLIVPYPIRMR